MARSLKRLLQAHEFGSKAYRTTLRKTLTVKRIKPKQQGL